MIAPALPFARLDAYTRRISICTSALLLMLGTAVFAQRSGTGRATGQPMPAFSLDSLRYVLRFPAAASSAGRNGVARITVSVNARGRVSITNDARSDKEFLTALTSAVGTVPFAPATTSGRPAASAVTLTAWFLYDNSYGRNIPFVDIAVDSASRASGPLNREGLQRAAGSNLEPVYSVADLSRRLNYPQHIEHGEWEDTVVVRALVERSGIAEHTFVEHVGNPFLDLAAEEAVRGLRFAPAMQLGTPVATWTNVPVRFIWKRRETGAR